MNENDYIIYSEIPTKMCVEALVEVGAKITSDNVNRIKRLNKKGFPRIDFTKCVDEMSKMSIKESKYFMDKIYVFFDNIEGKNLVKIPPLEELEKNGIS